MEHEEALVLVSQVTELNDLSQHMQDEDLDKLMGVVVKLLQKPDISPGAAAKLITQLQAFSTKCGLIYIYHSQWEKALGASEAAKRKRSYNEMRAMVDKLVDALKYSAKSFG